ncbi:uncharacterized protein J4E84_007402 [Alternaria hordeiaustralica]|uniref:uncharacterized protein n=1 Tax=Alternaria hordeiaustralica TaxID=1187925 RepID=UPI0020C4D5BD|nr:uncharacterized protein J4E84_007402 [Alternaria hordeiaustralica]KAI4681806.1 hypothetical protein J4E84_007402 [Alternaria hordeiaustralica]
MVLRLLPNLKRAHLGDRTSSDLHRFQPYRKPKNGPYWQMPFQFGTFNQLSEVVLDCDHWRHQWLEGVLPLLKHGNLKTLRINDIRDSDVDDHEEMALIGLPEHEETKRKNIEALERIMSDTELWGKLQVLELRPGPICWDEMVLPIMHACRGLRKLSFGVEDRHTDRYASTHILASKMWPVMIQLQGYVEELAIWAELWRHKKSHFDDGFVSFSKLRHLAIDDCALRGDWHEYGLQDLFPSSLETLRLHGLSEYRMKHVWAADGLLQRLSNAKKSDSQMFPRLWYLELSCGDVEEIDLYSDENTPERVDALIGDLRDAGIWARPMLDKYPHCTDLNYPKDSRWYRDISTKELEDYKQAKDDAYFERWGPWYTTGFINEDEVREDMYWHFNR